MEKLFNNDAFHLHVLGCHLQVKMKNKNKTVFIVLKQLKAGINSFNTKKNLVLFFHSNQKTPI